ncbi:MAG: ATP-dependent zinc protease [Oceanospirillales bacterium]|uniref:Retropepsin-like aspartic endopeptidase domain-containing protein n=1 Tax=Marinobacterium halophilum TaxID=267374 RepID=A0A2P8EQS2_9GAMM|nr:ATP-dependent zinc protease [Marinobacterium halophilum]MBR9827709.1 ATP-dependent zinc protease [Oceanospirillales bacterium]PSL11795.1 hypothetical protein CLV44_12212 [Marinobacterium halophilum]
MDCTNDNAAAAAVEPALSIAGWREWISLPELGISHIKAKMDTGARTSCIHAFEVEPFERDGAKWVRFRVHPDQGSTERVITCEAEVADFRAVTDSGGHTEMRYVIKTMIEFNNMRWPAEFTLTNRDTMKFRMLVGRTTMNGRLVVNPSLSYQLSVECEAL